MQYKNWTNEEIQKLINLRSWYKNKTIDWNRIAERFTNRSASQCKSFYYNRLKHFSFKDGPDGEMLINWDFVEYVYLYYISGGKGRPIESHDDKVKNVFVQCCIDDSISLIPLLMKANENSDSSQYETYQDYALPLKLMQGGKMFFELHNKWKDEIIRLFEKSPEEIQFHGFTIQRKTWEEFVSFWASQPLDELFAVINKELEKVIMVDDRPEPLDEKKTDKSDTRKESLRKKTKTHGENDF